MSSTVLKRVIPKVCRDSSKSIDDKDAAFSVLYNCVVEVVELVMGHVLRTLYCHRLSKTNDGHCNVYRQLLKQKWSEKVILQKFGKFKELLHMDVRIMEKVDAEFGILVIKELCRTAFAKLSADARSKILLLPKYKFKICRSYGNSIRTLKQEVAKIKSTVNIIYGEMDEEFNCENNNTGSVAAVLQCTEQKLQKSRILKEPLEDVDVKVLISAQQELQWQYKTLQVHGPFQYLVGMTETTEPIFAPLSIGPLDCGTPVDVKNLLTTTQMWESIDDAEVLLLCGAPGAGKTSLCYFLLHDWCKWKSQVVGLDNIDLVLLVEQVRVQGQPSLDHLLLNNLLKRTKAAFSDQLTSAACLLKYDVLVVVDGFTAHDKNHEENILHELFHFFNSSLILMSTEPSSLGHVEAVLLQRNNLPSVTVSISHLDFSTQMSLSKYACHLTKSSMEEGEIWNEFMRHHSSTVDCVLDYCQEPATILLYAALWKPGKPTITTLSGLHRFIIEGLFNKFSSHTDHVKSKKGDLKQMQIFRKLGELAWRQLCQNCHIVPLNMAVKLEVLELLPTFTTIVGYPPQSIFSFTSLSQQLHFAATFLAPNIMENPSYFESIRENVHVLEKYPKLLPLLVGELLSLKCDCVALKTALALGRLIHVKADDFNFWYLLQREGSQSPLVAKFVARMLPADHWCLGHTTVVPALKMLSRTPATVTSIIIDIPNKTEPYGIPGLLSILKELHTSFKRKVNLELYLWLHEDGGGCQPSNKLLHALAPWANLTNFTGEIGPEKNGLLFNPRSLRTLRTRISSVAALHTLRCITRHLPKICQKVRVTLDLPSNCDLAQLQSLDCSHLQMTLKEVNEENMSYVLGVVKRIGGRNLVERLCLNMCCLSVKSLPAFLEKLNGLVSDKVSLYTSEDLNKKTQQSLQHMVSFTISWL